MSTWGKKTIDIDQYEPRETLYYDYSTCSDIFLFIHHWYDDYNFKWVDSNYYLGDDVGRAMMEGFIDHVMAMDNLTEEQFVERYIKNNKFRRAI